MSEPLTKDKLNLCSNPRCDDHYIVELDDLKSALEEFEKLINETIAKDVFLRRMGVSNDEIRAYNLALEDSKKMMKKAFPAIYDKEV